MLVSVLPSGEASGRSSAAGTANGVDFDHGASKAGALSGDASRAYWTASTRSSGPGALDLRTNIGAAQSPLAYGVAEGAGPLIGPASGTGNTRAGGTVEKVQVAKGAFAVGQQISDPGGKVKPGTTITAIEEEEEKVIEGVSTNLYKLTLSQAPSFANNVALSGAPSNVVAGASATSGAYAEGQQIGAPGLPAGTTIEAVSETSPGAFQLTLSENPLRPKRRARRRPAATEQTPKGRGRAPRPWKRSAPAPTRRGPARLR